MKARLTFKKKENWSGYNIYPDCKHVIGPYLMRSGVRYTGLEGSDFALIKERFEKELSIDLSPQSAYWDDFNIQLGAKDLILDTDVLEQELQYYFLKRHRRVAFGLDDRKASTDYVLLQAEEEAKASNTRARVKRRAVLEFSKMSLNDMRQALRLLGYNSTSSSPELLESNLYALVEENPSRFLNTWTDNKDKTIQFLIEEACSKGVLRKEKTVYKYGSDVIGYTQAEAILYLSNPINSDLRVTILAQLEGKDIAFGGTHSEESNSVSEISRLKKEIAKEAEALTKKTKKTVKED